MRRRTSLGEATTSAPATMAVPASGVRSVVRIDTAVVLPAPLGPSSPRTVPSVTARSRSSKATTEPYLFTRPRASTAGPGGVIDLVDVSMAAPFDVGALVSSIPECRGELAIGCQAAVSGDLALETHWIWGLEQISGFARASFRGALGTPCLAVGVCCRLSLGWPTVRRAREVIRASAAPSR